MTAATKPIPKGCKQTEIGVIPSDWEQNILGNLTVKIGSGKTPTGGEKVYQKEGRPLMRSQNVGWGELLLDNVAYISDSIHETFPSTEIEVDDVLLNITGASIGRCAVADSRIVGGNVNQHVCIIRTKKSRLNPLFLEFFLISAKGQKQIDDFQAGGNRQGLNFGQISSFKITIPSSESEQTAIATALFNTNTLIEKLTKLIEKKKNIKQGAMQELLTGKRRLPGFSGKWEKKRLGDISRIESGINKATSFIGKGGVMYVTVMELYEGSSIQVQKAGRIDLSLEEEARFLLQKGDIVFGKSSVKRSGIAYPNIFIGYKEPVVFSGFTFRTRMYTELTDPFFIIHALRMTTVRNWLINNAQASALTNINQVIAKNTPLFIPQDVKEQTAIATVLSDMDAETERLESQLSKYQNLKQGMMQTLLTGKIRLI